MVVVPLITDQPTIAKQVSHMNMGVELNKNKLSAIKIKKAVYSVLNNENVLESVRAMQEKTKAALNLIIKQSMFSGLQMVSIVV